MKRGIFPDGSTVLRFAFVTVLLLLVIRLRGAEEVTYRLTGRIMDTSDNWLPDVQVALAKAGVATHTDGNGQFELAFKAQTPWAPGKDGNLDTLRLVKLGYQVKTVAISEIAYFTRPIVEKMEPNPVQSDTVAFTVRMPSAHSIHGLKSSLEPGAGLSASRLREALDRVARRSGTEMADARFYAYVPKGTVRLKAAFLISLHGMGTIDHPVLRRFADDESIALVGLEGSPVQRGCYPIELLDPHLQRLGAAAGHPELATVPVLTFGHSNGTGFATVYAAGRPERLIGWISYHSGFDWQLLLPGVEKAPGLVMHGHLDAWLANGQEQAVQSLRRERNAPVAMMLEGNVGHGPVDTTATWEFVVAFCRSALRARLGNDGNLLPVKLPGGWLGARYDRSVGGQQTLAIAPYENYAGDRSDANWLPDRVFAEVWQRYGMTNPRTATRKAPP